MSRLWTMSLVALLQVVLCVSCSDSVGDLADTISHPEADMRYSQCFFQDLDCRYAISRMQIFPKSAEPFKKNIPSVIYDIELSQENPEIEFEGRKLLLMQIDGGEIGYVFSETGRIKFAGTYGRHSVRVGLPCAGLAELPVSNVNPLRSKEYDIPKGDSDEKILKLFFASSNSSKPSFGSLIKDVTTSKIGIKNYNNDIWRMLYNLYPEETAALIGQTDGDFSKIPDVSECEKIAEKSRADSLVLKTKLFEKSRKSRLFAFVKRHPIDASYIAYTEGLSDATGECTFAPESELCTVEIFPDGRIKESVLLSSPEGVVRDIDVSYDARKIIFSWKKNAEDDYHLYEIYIGEDGKYSPPKQLTFGRYADTEAAYLPNGDIVFASTRCGHTVDCYNADVSNLYMMRSDTSFMRRIAFDQVHTLYPKVLPDGDIVYTRWDYSDRAQIFTQGIFTMRADGTFQSELYGNKSWFPTSIIHSRGIPDSKKIIAILSGHHTGQRGKLAIINPSEGTQEGEGIKMLAPVSEPHPVRVDKYGQKGTQFSYPFPFSEELFMVSIQPYSEMAHSHSIPSSLYLCDADGRKALISSHPYLHCVQAVEIAPRPVPKAKPSTVDYSKNTAELFVRNIYDGYATSSLPRGSIKKLRIIKPLFERRAGIGNLKFSNDEGGVKIFSDVFTPISLAHGSWDAKEIVGEVPVAPDGSVHFTVPSREPVYFQVVDENGNVAVTMRSWAGFQSGEFYSCAGCHGHKNLEAASRRELVGSRLPVKPLPFYDVGRFSFRKVIQPILDANCAVCHINRDSKRLSEEKGRWISVSEISPAPISSKSGRDISSSPFSLLDVPVPSPAAKRIFNDAYCNLLSASQVRGSVAVADYKNSLVNWPGALSVPTLLPAYYRGAAKSRLMRMLSDGHSGVELSREDMDKLACWIDLGVPYCGDYEEAADWSDSDRARWKYYSDKAEIEKKTRNGRNRGRNKKINRQMLDGKIELRHIFAITQKL